MKPYPKIAHFFWGNYTMPWIRYMSIKTFSKWNPDWQIVLYVPRDTAKLAITWATREQDYSIPDDDYTHMLADIPNLRIETIHYDNAIWRTSAIFQSDYLRMQLLATVGGLWSDNDIIFIKPMSSIVHTNPEAEAGIFTGMYRGWTFHPTGFLLASPNCNFYKRVVENQPRFFDTKQYQSICANMFNCQHPAYFQRPEFETLPMDIVYAYDWTDIHELYLDGAPKRITDRTIGVHWYAGSPLSEYAVKMRDANGNKTIDHTVRMAICG